MTLVYADSCGHDGTKETQTSDFKRVQIGINVSPDSCFPTVKNNAGTMSGGLVIGHLSKIQGTSKNHKIRLHSRT